MSTLGQQVRPSRPRMEPVTRESLDAVAAADGPLLGDVGLAQRSATLNADLLGLGPLEACVSDPQVTDVLVNGDGSVWLDRGRGVERCLEVALETPERVRALAVRLAGLAGRRLDDAQPFVDAQVRPGVRLHAVLPPVATDGPHVSLRLAGRRDWTLDRLRDGGMLDGRLQEVLGRVVRARRSFLVTGGTGSGKSTLLAACLAAGDPTDRVVIVEDVTELRVATAHVVRLQGRGRNVEGAGSVTVADLVRQALRMRPDRLVVGEARGAEVRELLSALNTGHAGGCATLHANRPRDVPARLAALGALAGLSVEAVAAQAVTAIEIIIHVARVGPTRVVQEVAVYDDGAVVPALLRRADGSYAEGPGAEDLELLCGAEGLGGQGLGGEGVAADDGGDGR